MNLKSDCYLTYIPYYTLLNSLNRMRRDVGYREGKNVQPCCHSLLSRPLGYPKIRWPCGGGGGGDPYGDFCVPGGNFWVLSGDFGGSKLSLFGWFLATVQSSSRGFGGSETP